MCVACSPFCGRCITPTLKAVKCSSCEANNVLTRDECLVYLAYRRADQVKGELKHGDLRPLCESCGADMSQDLSKLVVPMDCMYMELVCGFPCGRHKKTRRVGDPICAKQMPLGRLQTDSQ